jgi:hypothetical protein
MKFSLLPLLIILGGCVSGTIVGSEPTAPQASLVLAKAAVVYWIRPIHRSQGLSIDYRSPTHVWLTKGWYTVSYACNLIHPNSADWAMSINEYDTTRNVHIHPGRSVELFCSPNKLDVLDVQDHGSAPKNLFNPKPLPGSA